MRAWLATLTLALSQGVWEETNLFFITVPAEGEYASISAHCRWRYPCR